MMGEQVARIADSKNADFSVGDFITGTFGWRSHTVSSPESKQHQVRKVDPVLTQPKSTAIGILGMPGLVIIQIIYFISLHDLHTNMLEPL